MDVPQTRKGFLLLFLFFFLFSFFSFFFFLSSLGFKLKESPFPRSLKSGIMFSHFCEGGVMLTSLVVFVYLNTNDTLKILNNGTMALNMEQLYEGQAHCSYSVCRFIFHYYFYYILNGQ